MRLESRDYKYFVSFLTIVDPHYRGVFLYKKRVLIRLESRD